MPVYRVFMLGNDDHITGVEIVDCPSDDEAMTRAFGLTGDGKAVEVWELARRIGRVDLRHSMMAE